MFSLSKSNFLKKSFHFQPALPKVLDDEDEDVEDEDQYSEHNHSLMDSVDFFFTTDAEIKKIKQKV